MTGIFFATHMGYTELYAKVIAHQLGIDESHIHEISQATAADFAPYDTLLLGCPTFGYGELAQEWQDALSNLPSSAFSGKRVALFGCGNSERHGETFCDGIARLYEAMEKRGAKLFGAFVPEEGDYAVTTSEVCREGKFLGLALDRSDEADNDLRCGNWCGNLEI